MDDERGFLPIAGAQHTAAPATSSNDGVSRSIRTHPPADYVYKIQNFSLLSDATRSRRDFEMVHTGVFEAGGYKWRLHLYPHGHLDEDASGHISVYLVVADRKVLPVGWEINVNFKLFLYNHKEEHYLTLQDIEGRVTRFNEMKTENGFGKFISHGELNQLSNGYLKDDTIVIGAEVFVVLGNKRQLEGLISCCWPTAGMVSWKLSDFSEMQLRRRCPSSHVFFDWKLKWKLEAYVEEAGLKISLTLLNAGGTYYDFIKRWFQKEREVEFVPRLGDVYAEWGVRVKNQNHGEAEHIVKEGNGWFRADSRKWGTWSCTNVISLRDLTDESKGYVVNDTLIIDLVFDITREVKDTKHFFD